MAGSVARVTPGACIRHNPGMHVVENTIDIARPAEAVFGYCSDLRTEADWNPVAKTISLTSGEPIGVGSRFVGTWSGLGRSTLAVVAFTPPSSWTTETTEATLPFRLIGTVVASTATSSRLTMRIELLPTGAMVILAPVLRILMQRTAKANMTRIRDAAEQT
jgi:Polyketide cyclase / dehydrase and lipid transport